MALVTISQPMLKSFVEDSLLGTLFILIFNFFFEDAICRSS